MDRTPLSWVEGWTRTRIQDRKPQSAWKKSYVDYARALALELKRMGVTNYVITRNPPESERLDPGVSVYFSRAKADDFSWQVILGLDSPAPTLDEIDAAYRTVAAKHHPDRGGDIEMFRRASNARKSARDWVLGSTTALAAHDYGIACDKFKEARHNLNAIRGTIYSLRQIERYGTSALLDRALSSFKAQLTTGSTGKEANA